jgi:hypothetical protein
MLAAPSAIENGHLVSADPALRALGAITIW